MKTKSGSLQDIRLLFNLTRRKIQQHRFPAHVAIAVTKRCNLRCSYCYARYDTSEGDSIGTEKMFSLIDELYKRGTRLICFTGGEPLMRKDIKQLIDYVVLEKGMKCGMSSNGLLLEEKIALVKNLSSINISLDGNEEQHNRNRIPRNHKEVLNAIDFALSKNIPVATCTVLHRANMDCVDYIVQLAKRKGILCFFHILYGRLNPEEDQQIDRMDMQETRKVMKKIIDYKNAGYPVYYSNRTHAYVRDWPYENLKPIFQKTTPADKNGFKFIPCLAGDCYCFIDTDGSVYPCAALSEQVRALNFQEVGFKAAWDFLPNVCCKACPFFFQNELNLLFSLDLSVWLNFIKTTRILS